MRGLRCATVLVLACLLGVACGSQGDGEAELSGRFPQASAPKVSTPVTPAPGGGGGLGKHPCELLSQGDIAAAMGNPVRAGTTAGKACFWGTQVDRGTSATVTVNVPAAGKATEECTMQRNALGKDARQDPVNDLGTSAIWSWQQVAILLQGTLVACWSDAVVVVMLTGEREQAALRTTAANLTQTVRARL